ncbi:hypothetical protein [Crocosphaera sp. XPORK-15E]|uniref:hypothetical protein n=1 Tax=Crocosphaera sp. XPORK-15E TaxID=3110247 RepID=UPI002B1F62D1|nr:hypothetical protein [Crocosphaera sp. XPORK-15E]MEA5534061.1 hypothetical protein [Crocosphaera sp. XPORK-15E]
MTSKYKFGPEERQVTDDLLRRPSVSTVYTKEHFATLTQQISVLSQPKTIEAFIEITADSLEYIDECLEYLEKKHPSCKGKLEDLSAQKSQLEAIEKQIADINKKLDEYGNKGKNCPECGAKLDDPKVCKSCGWTADNSWTRIQKALRGLKEAAKKFAKAILKLIDAVIDFLNENSSVFDFIGGIIGSDHPKRFLETLRKYWKKFYDFANQIIDKW